MQSEIEDVRAQLLQFASHICSMANIGTSLSDSCRKLALESPLDPTALIGFVEAHSTVGSSASNLFRDEFELEVLEPLDMWLDESSQFLRELQRTVLAWTRARSVQSLVNTLLESAAESADDMSVEDELTLKLAKTDLGEACTNYSARCSGLEKHFSEIEVGRSQALDVTFTRLMAQQSFLLRPMLRVVEQQLITDPSLLSPTQQTGLTSPVRTPGGRMRLGSVASAERGGGGRRKGTLEEDIIRMSHRINRKNYLSHTHHYHSGLNAHSSHLHDSSSLSDIHPSLRTSRRIILSEGVVPKRPSINARTMEEAALLEACRELQREIANRQTTEAKYDDLRVQVERLKAEAGEKASLEARAEIEELKKKLAETQTATNSPSNKTNEEKKESEAPSPTPPVAADTIIVSPDAPPPPPMAPPLNVPMAPPIPMAPGAPAMGGGGGGLWGGRKVMTARDKELEDARIYGLPPLPNVDDLQVFVTSPKEGGSNDASAPPTTTGADRIQLKKIHWQSLTPEEVVKSDKNVWKELFLQSEADKNMPPPTLDDQTDSSLSLITDSSHDTTIGPLVPVIDSSVTSAANSRRPSLAASEYRWRWNIDVLSFAQSFAQKATKAMKKKVNTKGVNKYALGRKGAKTDARQFDDDAAGDEEEPDVDDAAIDPSSPSSSTNVSAARSGAPKKKALPKIDLIDAKRSYNLSISLSHFRLTPIEIRDAILHFDSDGRLANAGDLLDILPDLLPTSDEMKLIKSFVESGGDIHRLGLVETFFLAVGDPALQSRLKLLVTMSSFQSTTDSCQDLLESVYRGLQAIDSARAAIQVLLGLTLRIGNLMNASSLVPTGMGANKQLIRQTKQCYGFNVLNTLAKLRSVKSLDNSSTLLHWIHAYLSSESPWVVDELCALLPPLRDCVRVEQAFLQAEIRQLEQNLSATKKLIDEDEQNRKHSETNINISMVSGIIHQTNSPTPTSASASASNDAGDVSPPPNALSPIHFPSTSPTAASAAANAALLSATSEYIPLPPSVFEFYSAASVRLASLTSQLHLLQQLFTSLTSYYLVTDPALLSWEGFLTVWTLFISEWVQCEEESKERRAEEEKRRRLELARSNKINRQLAKQQEQQQQQQLIKEEKKTDPNTEAEPQIDPNVN